MGAGNEGVDVMIVDKPGSPAKHARFSHRALWLAVCGAIVVSALAVAVGYSMGDTAVAQGAQWALR